MADEHDEPTPGTLDDVTPDDAEEGAEASDELDAGGSESDDASDEQDETAQLRAELERERNARKQLLSEKSTWERTRTESESGQPKSPTGEADNGDAKLRAQFFADLALLEKVGQPGAHITEDETVEAFRAQARMQAANTRMNMARAQDDDLQRRLSKAEKVEDRTEAEKLIRGGKFSDPETAIEHVQLKRRLAELEAGVKAKDPKDDEADAKAVLARTAPQVGNRGMGAAETNRRTMKESDYYDRLGSMPNTSESDFEKKRQFQSKYRDRLILGK